MAGIDIEVEGIIGVENAPLSQIDQAWNFANNATNTFAVNAAAATTN